MAEIIDGKLVSSLIRERIRSEIAELTASGIDIPGLAVILVGEDPASQVYVRNKHKACADVGINSIQIYMPGDTDEESLLAKIDELNHDDSVHGILVQLPLPKHINEERVILSISKDKDVDAFHPINVGKIMTGNYNFLPCTPAGIMTLLEHYKIEISGKKCVIVGRSNIVGKPMALLLLEKNGTPTICHSRTANLSEVTREADILVVAIGRPNFIKGADIKDGAVVIDVGINRLPDGKLCGDVDYADAFDKCSYITPVPGGVGPMTITTLLQNTLTAAKLKGKK